MLWNCGVGEDSWESPGQQGDQTSQSWRKSTLNIYWKAWCWSWSSSTLTTWGEEPTYWKRLWCWKRFRARGEEDGRGWDGWMALPTQWTWVWANSGRHWGTGKPGVLQSMGLQCVGNDWAIEQQSFSPCLHIVSALYMSVSECPLLRKHHIGLGPTLMTLF